MPKTLARVSPPRVGTRDGYDGAATIQRHALRGRTIRTVARLPVAARRHDGTLTIRLIGHLGGVLHHKLADQLTRKQAIHRTGSHLNRSVVLQVAGSVHAAAATARRLNIRAGQACGARRLRRSICHSRCGWPRRSARLRGRCGACGGDGSGAHGSRRGGGVHGTGSRGAFSDRCGAGGAGGCLRARSAGARGCGGARGGGGSASGACRQRQQQRGTERYGAVALSGAERSRTSLGRSLGRVLLCRMHGDLSASSVRVPNQYSKDATCELAIRHLRNPQGAPARAQREERNTRNAIRGAE